MLIAGAGLAAYVCYRLAAPFLSPLAWALCLAVLLFPLHRRIESRLRHPNIAALISVAIAALILVVPGILVGQRLINETVEGAATLRAKVEAGAVRDIIASHPRFTPVANFIEQRVELPRLVDNAAAWVTSSAASLLRNSAIEAVRVMLTFYFLFYFLRDYRRALQSIKAAAPFHACDMDNLFQQIADTIHATIYGTIVVSAVQGALGGLMFWWLGLPGPLFWGFVMALLAILPVFGAFVVWIPAAISLALDGQWEKAVILTVWGSIVVGGIDNWIYPMLVGGRLKLHTILAFCAAVGGIIVFGPCGLIVGPVALTITIFLLHHWKTAGAPQTPLFP